MGWSSSRWRGKGWANSGVVALDFTLLPETYDETASVGDLAGTLVANKSGTTYALDDDATGKYALDGVNTALVEVADTLAVGTDSITVTATNGSETLTKSFSLVVSNSVFEPATVETYALDLDNTAMGTAGTWSDVSGNARNATQATVANQPLLVAAGKNGLNILRFDATDKMDVPDFDLTYVHIFAVVLVGAANGATRHILRKGLSNPAFIMRQNTSGLFEVYARNSANVQVQITPFAVTAGWHLVEMWWNGTTVGACVDGGTPNTAALSGTALYNNSEALNISHNGSDGTWQSDMGQIRIYDPIAGALSPGDIASIRAELNTKWGF